MFRAASPRGPFLSRARARARAPASLPRAARARAAPAPGSGRRSPAGGSAAHGARERRQRLRGRRASRARCPSARFVGGSSGAIFSSCLELARSRRRAGQASSMRARPCRGSSARAAHAGPARAPSRARRAPARTRRSRDRCGRSARGSRRSAARARARANSASAGRELLQAKVARGQHEERLEVVGRHASGASSSSCTASPRPAGEDQRLRQQPADLHVAGVSRREVGHERDRLFRLSELEQRHRQVLRRLAARLPWPRAPPGTRRAPCRAGRRRPPGSRAPGSPRPRPSDSGSRRSASRRPRRLASAADSRCSTRSAGLGVVAAPRQWSRGQTTPVPPSRGAAPRGSSDRFYLRPARGGSGRLSVACTCWSSRSKIAGEACCAKSSR